MNREEKEESRNMKKWRTQMIRLGKKCDKIKSINIHGENKDI